MWGALGILFIFCLGCDDKKRINHLPDAPLFPDGAPDAPDDAPDVPRPVTLTITNDGVAQVGIKVLFQNADSTLVSDATTDAAGVASALMMPGGYVTAVNPFAVVPAPTGALTSELATFSGVKPGDQLKLRRGAPPNGAVNVSVIAPDHPTATQYWLYTSCGMHDITGGGGSGEEARGAEPITLEGCGPTTDVVLVARDAGLPLASVSAFNVALTEGGTIDLGDASYTTAVDMTYTYSNIPAGLNVVEGIGQLHSPRGELVDWSFQRGVEDGSAAYSTKRPDVAGTLGVTVSRFPSGNYSSHAVLDWGPPASYVLDANILLPDYLGPPSFSLSTRTVSWSVAPGASQPDLAIAQTTFVRNKGSPRWDWNIVAAYSGASIKLPVLPESAAEYNPTEGDVATTDRLTTVKVPGGYDAVRANALSIESSRELVVGGTGRVIVEDLDIPIPQARVR